MSRFIEKCFSKYKFGSGLPNEIAGILQNINCSQAFTAFVNTRSIYFLADVFWKAFKHQVIRVIDHIKNLPAAKVTIGVHGIPVLLIHVVTGLDFWMLFPKLYSTF